MLKSYCDKFGAASPEVVEPDVLLKSEWKQNSLMRITLKTETDQIQRKQMLKIKNWIW